MGSAILKIRRKSLKSS